MLPAVSQDRPERPVAESELFYMASLQAKLENLNVSLNSTMATQKPTKKVNDIGSKYLKDLNLLKLYLLLFIFSTNST